MDREGRGLIWTGREGVGTETRQRHTHTRVSSGDGGEIVSGTHFTTD